jgi:hypothetical protein
MSMGDPKIYSHNGAVEASFPVLTANSSWGYSTDQLEDLVDTMLTVREIRGKFKDGSESKPKRCYE